MKNIYQVKTEKDKLRQLPANNEAHANVIVSAISALECLENKENLQSILKMRENGSVDERLAAFQAFLWYYDTSEFAPSSILGQ